MKRSGIGEFLRWPVQAGRRSGVRIPLAAAVAAMAVAGALGGPISARAATILSISQTVTGTAMVGQNVTFTVTMTNAGTAPVFEGMDDAPPSSPLANLISENSTGTTCARASRGAFIVCQPVTLAPGASITLIVTIRPLVSGNMANLAEGDPDFLYNSTETIQVAPAPTDVQVAGFASTGSPNRGATFSYTFQVKDNGPWNVGDVAFTDPLPTQVSFVGVSTDNGSTCSQAAGTVSCDLGGLNVGQQVNVVITVLAPTAPSTFTNTATVTPNVTDTQPSNNSVSVTVQVK